MTTQQQLQMLKGTETERLALMQELIQKTMNGETLNETEVMFMETLKREFLNEKPIKQVVEMSATIAAKSGIMVG